MSTCFVSAKDYAEHWPQKGDRVWYWARRTGEKAHKKRGIVKSIDSTFARVRLDEGVVPVQTVEVKRLNKE